MKRGLLFFILSIFVFIQCAASDGVLCPDDQPHNCCHTHDSEYSYRTVYICVGKYAYAYHSSPQCRGLNNCQGTVYSVTEQSAVEIYNRKPCCLCWQGVYGNCATDGTYNAGASAYGAGDPSALMAAGIVIAAASVAILSNDLYFYYGLKAERTSTLSSRTILDFGFRKTFKVCALEYGLIYEESLYKRSYYYYYDQYDETLWGGKLSFVHDLFYRKLPWTTRLYLGPSVNYINDSFGFGAITGFSWQPFDRLKLDVRYDFSISDDGGLNTNQFLFGLIFKYQKKYFWK